MYFVTQNVTKVHLIAINKINICIISNLIMSKNFRFYFYKDIQNFYNVFACFIKIPTFPKIADDC